MARRNVRTLPARVSTLSYFLDLIGADWARIFERCILVWPYEEGVYAVLLDEVERVRVANPRVSMTPRTRDAIVGALWLRLLIFYELHPKLQGRRTQ